jgi:hypothetical protein
LVDEIGYFEDAIRVVVTQPNYNSSSLSRNVSPRIITYSQVKKPIRNYYQINEEINMDLSGINQLLKNINIHTEVKFLYMWML